jgi:hypothetical protein
MAMGLINITMKIKQSLCGMHSKKDWAPMNLHRCTLILISSSVLQLNYKILSYLFKKRKLTILSLIFQMENPQVLMDLIQNF